MENRIKQLVDEKISTMECPSERIVLDRAYNEIERRNHRGVLYCKRAVIAACLIIFISLVCVLVSVISKPGTTNSAIMVQLEATSTPYPESDCSSTVSPTKSPEKVNSTEKPNIINPETVVESEIQGESSDTAVVVTECPQVENIGSDEEMKAPDSSNQDINVKPDDSQEEIKDSDNEENINEEKIEPTAIPEDGSWTESFVVSNSEYRFGIDKSEAISLIAKQYFSAPLNENSNSGEMKEAIWKYSVEYNGNIYEQACVEMADRYLVGEKIESLLLGFDEANEISKKTNATIYKIAGVSFESAIAVEIKEQEGYFLFVNSAYKPQTIQEFINAYNLIENFDIKAIAVYEDWITNVNKNIDAQAFWKILLSADSEISSSDYLCSYEVNAAIEIDCEIYGCIDIPVVLYDEGYIVFCLDAINGVYYIGEENVQAIKDLYFVN